MTAENVKRLGNLLGLAQRGGKLKASEPEIKAAIKDGQVKMLILASDATERIKKNFQMVADSPQNKVTVNQIENFSREDLGLAIGKSARSVVAVLDKGFCKAIEKIISNS